MRVRDGGGGKEGKIRLVTYARFSFPIGMQLLFKRWFEHAIITCHCVISGNAKLTPNKIGGAFGDRPVFSALDYCTSTVKGG